MKTIIIGNIFALIGCLFMVAVGFVQKKKQILTVQCFQLAFMGIGHLILGAMSGCISSIIGIIRNLVFAKREVTVPLKIFFIIVQLLLSVSALSSGLIEWLPLLATVIFTWYLDTKNDITIKIVIIVTLIMWLIYDGYYWNVSALFFDILTIISSLISMRMLLKNKK